MRPPTPRTRSGTLLKVDRSGTSADEVFCYDAYARLVCAKMATTTTCANTTSPITLTLDALDRTVNRTFGSSSTNDYCRGLTQDPVKTVGGTTTSLYAMGLDAPMAQKSKVLQCVRNQRRSEEWRLRLLSERMRNVRMVAIVGLLALSGCDTNPAGLTVGMEGSGGAIAVVHRSCPGEMVVSVEVVDAHDKNPGAGDTVLWRISSSGAPLPTLTRVGGSPPGFTTDVSLTLQLRGSSTLSLLLNTRAKPEKSPFTIFMEFSPGELKTGQILTDEGTYLSPEALASRAAKACP
jgi:hypothetical protein